MEKIAIATGNKGKLAEFQRYLETLKIEMYIGPKLKFPPEDGVRYLMNAAIKARHGAKEWGVPCVGEDSGIEVAGLNDLPGPFSARFSGFSASDIATGISRGTLAGFKNTEPPQGTNIDLANNNLILDLLRGKRGDDRIARYVACIVLCDKNGNILYAGHSSVEGKILEAPRGDKGFGFDPIMEFFQYPGKSVAELPMDQKNLVSHRGKAIYDLIQWLAHNFS